MLMAKLSKLGFRTLVLAKKGRTFSLQYSGLGLTGSMGYQLASLTAVTNFYISNNNLGNQIPYQLPPNCTQLNLAGNGFTSGIPYSIS
ncbi:protein STRUBBELIG-RECEPTOR FAMILY 7-like isoform X2 [Camellia sinensis]|uniref:protein STRUBBELIG-RECEPTOR FAMILY 7-like isoform X2 n=1 Tax=Camellia sinensis TaxID=4442 RepID=UPI0010362A3D|nr:protein STRUBBELIG-RECEPTOR FAMILY 7-like isoform X2 [Camellia sinensis]